jgi:hypothetical protein
MRDKRFIAEHRGGSLSRDDHIKLIRWSRECSEHVLFLVSAVIDPRLLHALLIAKEWENGSVKTGVAMKASLDAHAAARVASNPVSEAVARSIGHAVASAHMADHSLGGALFALKAVKLAGMSVNEELDWQTSQLQKLPPDIIEMVLNDMRRKAKSLKIF